MKSIQRLQQLPYRRISEWCAKVHRTSARATRHRDGQWPSSKTIFSETVLQTPQISRWCLHRCDHHRRQAFSLVRSEGAQALSRSGISRGQIIMRRWKVLGAPEHLLEIDRIAMCCSRLQRHCRTAIASLNRMKMDNSYCVTSWRNGSTR